MKLDPDSELILISQRDENIWHQGGALFFHPEDGFLYYSVGDEGDKACSHKNCQVISKDLFSGVFRIDVDMRGGELSHPIINNLRVALRITTLSQMTIPLSVSKTHSRSSMPWGCAALIA